MVFANNKIGEYEGFFLFTYKGFLEGSASNGEGF